MTKEIFSSAIKNLGHTKRNYHSELLCHSERSEESIPYKKIDSSPFAHLKKNRL
jgi:hypothetical protein